MPFTIKIWYLKKKKKIYILRKIFPWQLKRINGSSKELMKKDYSQLNEKCSKSLCIDHGSKKQILKDEYLAWAFFLSLRKIDILLIIYIFDKSSYHIFLYFHWNVFQLSNIYEYCFRYQTILDDSILISILDFERLSFSISVLILIQAFHNPLNFIILISE